MKTRLVRVGNSQAVRIPKLLIDQIGLQGDLEIEVKKQSLVIRRAEKVEATSKASASDNERQRKPKQPPSRRKAGNWVNVLLACPEKGWFQPMTSSESTAVVRSPFE